MTETLHIYTRVSTRIQEDGTSLDTQRDLGKKKAKESKAKQAKTVLDDPEQDPNYLNPIEKTGV